MAGFRLPVLPPDPPSAVAASPASPALGDGPVPADPLLDPFARRIRYLRLSLTDRCNYRCVYCMPEDVTFRPRAELLTFEEILRLMAVFARLGVRRVRLTGGEPTVRNGVVDLVARLAAVPGLDELVMTSNGHRLPELAGPLAAAGLRAVNVSLDTVDADRFHRLTHRGDLARVVAGIDAALAAGLEVKLNAVALAERGLSDAEVDRDIVGLCEFAWARGTVVRFIEHMPMSGGELFGDGHEITAARIRATVAAAFGALEPSPPRSGPPRGPSRYWRLVDAPAREVGIISAMTEHFCDDCNRLRLTASGELHACLGHDDATSLRDVLRAGGDDAAVERAIAAAVSGKRAGHEFQRSGAGGPTKHMVSIGG
jgi:cyclic pyranopterin phosphate synthase